ncbi:MAG: tRNA (adenosine(37)-N6)-threonylcarbamoyltransferase complex dimerization subunit type 1 TsaB [Candidatus Levybacteria bacterium]|nr:tRNA (adenosine(37)-N6)-threonylcarbamoyltransferase complex dimerization subunit type 1 TsaB [Candidatus Levybacteria bacterium]
MVVLSIDTARSDEIIVGITIEGRKYAARGNRGKENPQEVLSLVDQLLRKHTLQLKDIAAIHVSEGPGSFTGLRVGASVANALGFLLNVPINGKPLGELIEPVYS